MATRAGRQAMQGLGQRAWREVCTDVYDELVRRNVADREGGLSQDRGGQGQQARTRSMERERREQEREQETTYTHTDDPGTAHFANKRLTARRKFAAMADGPFGEFVVLVLGELERRCKLVARAELQPQQVPLVPGRVHDDGRDWRDRQDEDAQGLAYQASRVRECDAAGQLGRMSVSAVRGAVVSYV